jgi:hypothetical protein
MLFISLVLIKGYVADVLDGHMILPGSRLMLLSQAACFHHPCSHQNAAFFRVTGHDLLLHVMRQVFERAVGAPGFGFAEFFADSY